MKRNILLATVFLIIAVMAGCSEIRNKIVITTTVVPSVSPMAELSPIYTYLPTVTESLSMHFIAEPQIPVITDEPIPDLLGNQWYDWDKVGAYPGASVVQCGDRIAFQMLKYVGDNCYDSYLSFANPDGSDLVKTKIKDSSNPNYKDGWVYMICKNESICKVKTDGSELKTIYKAQTDIAGAKDIFLSDLLIVEDEIYVFNNITYDNELTSIFMCMNIDGSEQQKLDEFDHYLKDTDFFDRHDYSTSLFYDSGKLYYIKTDPDNYMFDLYQYKIATKNKICLAKGLSSGYNYKIVVRGDKVFYSDGEIHSYTISTGDDEVFIPTNNIDIGFLDFGFFDRWLLMSGDDEIYCYDMEKGKLYLVEEPGSASNIVITQKNVYFEEPDYYPFLSLITFNNGEVTVGSFSFNRI